MSHVKKAPKCISEQLILAQPDKLQTIMAGNIKEMTSGNKSLKSSVLFSYI